MKLDDDVKRLKFVALLQIDEETYRALFAFDGDEAAVIAWNSWEHPEWVSERLSTAVALMLRQEIPVDSMSFSNGFTRIGPNFLFTIAFKRDAENNEASWSLEEIMQDNTRVKWAKVPEEYVTYARTRLE